MCRSTHIERAVANWRGGYCGTRSVPATPWIVAASLPRAVGGLFCRGFDGVEKLAEQFLGRFIEPRALIVAIVLPDHFRRRQAKAELPDAVGECYRRRLPHVQRLNRQARQIQQRDLRRMRSQSGHRCRRVRSRQRMIQCVLDDAFIAPHVEHLRRRFGHLRQPIESHRRFLQPQHRRNNVVARQRNGFRNGCSHFRRLCDRR